MPLEQKFQFCLLPTSTLILDNYVNFCKDLPQLHHNRSPLTSSLGTFLMEREDPGFLACSSPRGRGHMLPPSILPTQILSIEMKLGKQLGIFKSVENLRLTLLMSTFLYDKLLKDWPKLFKTTCSRTAIKKLNK